jgi:hypothetical protein
VLLVGPAWIGPADDGSGRKRAEIPAVEGVLGLPVHEEDIAAGDDAAGVPNGQRTAQMIAVERVANRDTVDSDRAVRPADDLAWNGTCFSSGTPFGR